jgi:hypothetical protein
MLKEALKRKEDDRRMRQINDVKRRVDDKIRKNEDYEVKEET